MKTCTKCKLEKSRTEFYRGKSYSDGLQYVCKKCQKKTVQRWRKNNPERTRKVGRLSKRRQREREGPDETCRKWNEWYANNAEHRRGYQAERRDTEKEKAQHAIYSEMRAGRLIRPDNCSRCDEERKVIAHHEDYSKPLEVQWLCRSCHSFVHGLILV